MKKLNELTVTETSEGLRSGKFSSAEVTKECLLEIKKKDKEIHAFVTVNSNAIQDAEKADKEIINGSKKILLGVPIAIKDSFLTVGIKTTASSKVLGNYWPQYDATVVRKLKEAGAIILGKTNMDAWAHGSSTETSDFGATRNPWNTEHLPGGSSGGSAAATAANMCIAAIGSETAGSVRQPAAWCGVVGLKPTYGRVSRYGVIAMASSTDSPGPLAKTVRDAELIYGVIAGHDSSDATSSRLAVERTDFSENNSLEGIRIGLVMDYLLPEMRDDVKNLIRKAAKHFESLGAAVTEVKLIPPKYAIGVYTIIQRSEVSSNLARFDGMRYGNDRTYFGDEAKRRIMLGTYTLSSGYYDQYYAKAQKVRALIIEDFRKAFTKVDAVIGAVSPGPALKAGASKNQPMFGEMEDKLVEASSIAGLCGTSVPCGFVDGLPIGLQITGNQFNENKILKISDIYERTK